MVSRICQKSLTVSHSVTQSLSKIKEYRACFAAKKIVVYSKFIIISVASWGLAKDSKKSFRLAMSLMSGELSGLSGSFLMMTATATPATRRILQSQMPEIKKWTNLLSPPLRTNVQILIPPPVSISSKGDLSGCSTCQFLSQKYIRA